MRWIVKAAEIAAKHSPGMYVDDVEQRKEDDRRRQEEEAKRPKKSGLSAFVKAMAITYAARAISQSKLRHMNDEESL